MKVIRVVAAAIMRGDQVLIAKRPEHAHQGGLWEFPGGKIEAEETPQAALIRELQEEIGITPTQYSPLIQITHRYPDKAVHLDVWKVHEFQGEAQGLEGQPIQWSSLETLSYGDFPAANKAIIDALRFPSAYGISGHWRSDAELLAGIDQVIGNGVTWLQLRCKQQTPDQVQHVINVAKARCAGYPVKLFLNTNVDLLSFADQVDGVHLNSEQLEYFARHGLTLPDQVIVGASCHSEAQIDQAHTLGAHYISVSPVAKTQTHPDQQPLGWSGFSALTAYAKVPVYALGGMTPDHIPEAIAQGGQGIAAISAYWQAQ